MLELNEFDDVGHTYYKCQDEGVPMSMNLGKHTNDHMLSFYLVSPSGFDIEYWPVNDTPDKAAVFAATLFKTAL